MNPVAAIVVYLVIWFMCLFVILPLRLRSQHEAGDVVPGTPASAPENPHLRRKFMWVTILATAIWVPIVAIIISGVIGIEDIDFFDRM